MRYLLIWALVDATTTNPSPPASQATTQFVIAALSAGGIGAIVASIVTGLFSKKKLGAEATEIITKAAAGVVASLNSEIERLTSLIARQDSEHNAALDKIKRDHTRQMDEVKQVLELHTAWDQVAIARLSEIGVDLPPAPELFPESMRRRMDR